MVYCNLNLVSSMAEHDTMWMIVDDEDDAMDACDRMPTQPMD